MEACCEMMSHVVLCTLVVVVVLFIIVFCVNLFLRRRLSFRWVFVSILLYMSWWQVDVFLLYIYVFTTVPWRSFFLRMFRAPDDIDDPILLITINSDDRHYTGIVWHKYEARYVIGIDGGMECSKRDFNVVFHISLKTQDGKLIHSWKLARQAVCSQGLCLTYEVPREAPQRTPLILELDIEGDLHEFLREKERVQLFIRASSNL